MVNREQPLPLPAAVVSMREYILERRLSVAPQHHGILRSFTDYEGIQALAEYNRQLQAFEVKMANIALSQYSQQQNMRYPEEFDELYGDER